MNALVIALKDLRRTFRSLFAVGMMLGAPLLLTGLLHVAFGQLGRAPEPTAATAPAPLTVVVADLEHGAPSAALGRGLIETLRQPAAQSWLRVREVSSEAEVRAGTSSPASAGVIIPDGFSAAHTRDATAPALQLVAPTSGDAAAQHALEALVQQFLDSVTASRVATATADVVAEQAGVPLGPERRAALVREQAARLAQLRDPGTAASRAWLEVRRPLLSAAPPAEARASAAPPVLATVTTGLLIFFMFFTAGHSAQSIPLEAQSGTLARLFTTSVSRGQILLGKFLSVFVIVAVQATLLLSLSAALLAISWGPLPALAVVVFGVVSGAGGFGVLLVALARSPRESSIIVSSVSAGAGMLGGLFTSAVQMPAAFELCGLLLPQGWAMRSFKLLLGGAGVLELLAPAAISVGIGAACLAAGVLLFRRRFR